MNPLIPMGERARAASRALALVTSGEKNRALCTAAAALRTHTEQVLEANKLDLDAARAAGINEALADRLLLNRERIEGMAAGLEQVAALTDPVGELAEGWTRPNGLEIRKIRVPIGVVGFIFEARPNVTVDGAALCLKSSNACILRGGKEAIYSNRALAALLRGAIEACGLPADCVQLIEDTSRQSASDLMALRGYLDLLIPRGGKGLIRSIVENAQVPVIETGAGNCHTFVDRSAELEMAVRVCDNAKTSRPSVCNAMETLLVHRDIAPAFLPLFKERLSHEVELRGCARAAALLPGIPSATEADYAEEFDDYILAVRVVDSLEDAIAHIRTYSTGHSEAILTNDYAHAQQFIREIDAAAVFVNASTRFTDGAEFGFGAEIGISTQKLHARGPMALRELCSTKYIVSGNGQIR